MFFTIFIGKIINLMLLKNNIYLVIEKDKEKRINDYMELLYGDEELIESLI